MKPPPEVRISGGIGPQEEVHILGVKKSPEEVRIVGGLEPHARGSKRDNRPPIGRNHFDVTLVGGL